jgi:hypothetical protein
MNEQEEPGSKRQVKSAMTNQPSPSSVHQAFPGKQEKESNRSNYHARNVFTVKCLLSYFFRHLHLRLSLRLLPFFTLESLALETLLACPASTHRLPPHCAIGSSGLLLSLLGRAGTGALSAHGSGARERVAATSTADVNHTGRRELGGCWLWGNLWIHGLAIESTIKAFRENLRVRCPSPASIALPGLARADDRSRVARSSTCLHRRRQSGCCSCAQSRCCCTLAPSCRLPLRPRSDRRTPWEAPAAVEQAPAYAAALEQRRASP